MSVTIRNRETAFDMSQSEFTGLRVKLAYLTSPHFGRLYSKYLEVDMLSRIPNKKSILSELNTQIELLILDGIVGRQLLDDFYFASDIRGSLSTTQCRHLLHTLDNTSDMEAYKLPGRVSNENYSKFHAILHECSKRHWVLNWI